MYIDASGLSNFQKSASSANQSMFGNIKITMLHTITIALNVFCFFLNNRSMYNIENMACFLF